MRISLVPGYDFAGVRPHMRKGSSFCGDLPHESYLDHLQKDRHVRRNARKCTLYLRLGRVVTAFALVRFVLFGGTPSLFVDLVCSTGRAWALLKAVELLAASFGVPYVTLTSLYKPYMYYRKVLGYKRRVTWYPRGPQRKLPRTYAPAEVRKDVGLLYKDESARSYDLSDGVHLFKRTDAVCCNVKLKELGRYMQYRRSILLKGTNNKGGKGGKG